MFSRGHSFRVTYNMNNHNTRNQWRSHHRVEPGQPTRLSFWGKKARAGSLARSRARSLAHALDLIPNSLARSVAPRTRRQPPGLGRPSPSAVSPAPTVASRPRRRQAPTARPRPPVPVGRLPSAQWSADRRQASPPPGPDRQASRPPFKVRELPIPTSSCSFSAAP
jgi:hypothetical protein